MYIRTKAHLNKAFSIVKTFADDINMEFGLDKCTIAVMKGGKQIKSQNMTIDHKTSIQILEEAAYKYLGVDEMKEKIAKEYYRRVRLIFRSELNSKTNYRR